MPPPFALGASICRASDWVTCYRRRTRCSSSARSCYSPSSAPSAAARAATLLRAMPVPSSAPGAAARIIALLCAAPAPSSTPGIAAILPATAPGAAARVAALLRPRCSSSLGPLDPSPEKAEERRCWIEERERENGQRE